MKTLILYGESVIHIFIRKYLVSEYFLFFYSL